MKYLNVQLSKHQNVKKSKHSMLKIKQDKNGVKNEKREHMMNISELPNQNPIPFEVGATYSSPIFPDLPAGIDAKYWEELSGNIRYVKG